MVELATLLADLSELTSARQMYRQLLDRRWRELTFARQLPQQVLRMWAWVLGDSLTIGHADLVWMDELASILRESGELIAARKLRQEILEGRQQTLGVAHRGTLAAVDDLAAVLEDLGEPDAARDLRRKYRGLARTAPAGIGAAMARRRQRAGAA